MEIKTEITTSTLKKMLNTWSSFSCKPSFEKMKEGTVIDENQSVKWNREKVIENNEKYDEEVIELRQKRIKLRTTFDEAVRQYIVEEANVSKEVAVHVYNYLEIHIDDYWDLINSLDDMIELILKIK